MRIAIIGYGKMGKEIESLALSTGNTISLIIDVNNSADLNPQNLSNTDIAFEFTHPLSAVKNYIRCFEAGVPVVSGTTGWKDQLPEVLQKCQELNGTLFHAPNFNLGVNIFYSLAQKLASVLKDLSQYEPYITEIHHTAKADKPSGTAIALAERILGQTTKTKWVSDDPSNPAFLNITSIREGNVTGIHTLEFKSDYDTISLTHNAHNRKGFAYGAMLAAEFIIHKKGLYTMNDLLQSLNINKE